MLLHLNSGFEVMGSFKIGMNHSDPFMSYEGEVMGPSGATLLVPMSLGGGDVSQLMTEGMRRPLLQAGDGV